MPLINIAVSNADHLGLVYSGNDATGCSRPGALPFSMRPSKAMAQERAIASLTLSRGPLPMEQPRELVSGFFHDSFSSKGGKGSVWLPLRKCIRIRLLCSHAVKRAYRVYNLYMEFKSWVGHFPCELRLFNSFTALT